MREDWKLKKLGDICFIRRGSSPRPIKNYLIQEGGMPWVKISDATEANGKFINSTAEQIKMEGVSKSVIVNPGDLILSNSGTAGLPMFMGITACIHDGWQTFRDLNGIDKEYLYYFLLFIRNILLHNAYDSVMKNLTLDMLRDYEIYLPPMDEQKRIVDVLHTIDNKIENNNKINRNLSEQAQALYKSWFVDLNPFEGERPADWQDGTVDDLASEVVCGKTPSTKKEEYYGNDIPFVTIPDMHGCVYTIHTERSLSELGAESQSKKTLPKNSICVSCIGTAGLVTLLPVPSQTNQQINSIIPKDNYSPYYIYLLMSTMRETINKLGQAGSTIVNLNKTQFGKIEVLIPSIKTMSDFDEIVEPVFSAILSNQIENEKLANLRDSLLPKLMSGEIDVSDLEI